MQLSGFKCKGLDSETVRSSLKALTGRGGLGGVSYCIKYNHSAQLYGRTAVLVQSPVFLLPPWMITALHPYRTLLMEFQKINMR